jgi:hypothetical protein
MKLHTADIDQNSTTGTKTTKGRILNMRLKWHSWTAKSSRIGNSKASADLFFDALQKQIAGNKSELEVKNTKEVATKTKEAEARAVDFSGYFGYLTDARLEDLAETYCHWKFGEAPVGHKPPLGYYDITFAAFVKSVISGRWQEYVGTVNVPPSTILPKYKLRAAMLRQERASRRNEINWILPTILVGSIVVILLLYHVLL